MTKITFYCDRYNFARTGKFKSGVQVSDEVCLVSMQLDRRSDSLREFIAIVVNPNELSLTLGGVTLLLMRTCLSAIYGASLSYTMGAFIVFNDYLFRLTKDLVLLLDFITVFLSFISINLWEEIFFIMANCALIAYFFS